MAIRTKLLAGGRTTSTSAVVIYTCPDGETAILKSLHLQNLNLTTNVEVIILMDAGAFDKTTFERFNVPASAHVAREWWVVLPAGAEIGLQLSVSQGVNYWLSGTELEGVAD